MPTHTATMDLAALTLFQLSEARDNGLANGTMRVMERSATPSTIYNYQLQDPGLWRTKFEAPVLTVMTRSAGSIVTSFVANRHAMAISMEGEESHLFCFTTPLGGQAVLIDRAGETIGTPDCGFVLRPGPQAQLLVGDGSTRSNVFLVAAEVVGALERVLDRHLREPLEFRRDLDWSKGLASSLKGQLAFVTDEFQRPDGITSNPVALACAADLLLALVLRGAQHNYTSRMERGPDAAIPAYVRRAEEFMCSHAAEPLRMAQIALAAGCSVRSLGVVFRKFRETTPLEALHAIRLEQVRSELTRGSPGVLVAMVARRYGFTNAGRFRVAFWRRFGELPSDAARRA